MRVIEVSAFVAAPLGGALLASLGADVVRIDPLGGGIDCGRWPLHGDASLYWAGLNQGKRSVTIDTRSDRGQELATALVAAAGTVVTNLPARGWCSYDELRRCREDLVMVILTGNPDGSAAVDYTVNAAVGFPLVTGPEGWRGPVNHVLPAWDALTGYLLVSALLAAELHRVRSAEGQLVAVSLADVALSVASHLGFLAEAQLSDEPRARIGNDLYGTYAHDFETADGRFVIVVALTPRQWRSLVEATGIADAAGEIEARRGLNLENEGDRYRARDELTALIRSWVKSRTLAQVERAFGASGVLWERYQTFQQLVREDERCSTANPIVSLVHQPGIGSYLRTGAPVSFARAARLEATPAPTLGGHTHEVIGDWLGLGPAELDQLAAGKVINPRARS